ncbi:PASTA domain-containing protein [Kordia sp.]|uniref:PASTA domain-containing protein n=1 Tax=Kordia sp. TaxID=1965332 RepID=UPI003D2ADEA8
MAVNINSIQFKHLLYDVANKPAKTVKVQIQFYNVHTKSWLSLTDDIPLLNGKLVHAVTIPSRISTKNQTIRVVREVLKSGGTPSFRIIKVNDQNRLPEVVTTTFEAIIEADTNLTIDFSKSWLLHTDKFISKGDHLVVASQVSMFELTDEIRVIKEEKENVMAQLTGLNEAVANLSNERELLQNDIQNSTQEVANLNVSLETVKTNLATERTLRQTLETNQATLETQLQAQRDQIEAMEVVSVGNNNFEVLYNDLQQQVSDISIDKSNLQQQVSNITTERDNLNQEKASFLASIDVLKEAVKKEKLIVETKDVELQAKQTLIKSLERKTVTLERQLEEATDFKVTEHPNKLSASKVYGSIVNDVIKADEELINSRYKLANVSLNLKTTVEKGPEGTIFGLLDFETAKDINSAAISDISIDIVPNATTVTDEGQKMPNILGLTETAVRKILLNNGLKLDAVYHPTNDDHLIVGQSFKQSPAADTSITEGQEVIVIFAKPIN